MYCDCPDPDCPMKRGPRPVARRPRPVSVDMNMYCDGEDCHCPGSDDGRGPLAAQDEKCDDAEEEHQQHGGLDSCPICFEPTEPANVFTTIDCRHSFCRDCVQQLPTLSCPLCRTPMRGVGTSFDGDELTDKDIFAAIYNREHQYFERQEQERRLHEAPRGLRGRFRRRLRRLRANVRLIRFGLGMGVAGLPV